jgi:hypothetical protein
MHYLLKRRLPIRCLKEQTVVPMKLRRPSKITREKTLLYKHCNARERTGFNSRPAYVRFVMDKVALG